MDWAPSDKHKSCTLLPLHYSTTLLFFTSLRMRMAKRQSEDGEPVRWTTEVTQPIPVHDSANTDLFCHGLSVSQQTIVGIVIVALLLTCGATMLLVLYRKSRRPSKQAELRVSLQPEDAKSGCSDEVLASACPLAIKGPTGNQSSKNCTVYSDNKVSARANVMQLSRA